jgi:acetate CoA/acetoacetate CoA-transferase alpha subunit
MNKLINLEEAVSKIKSGMTVMVGGFLTKGGPNLFMETLADTDVSNLTLICNDSAYVDRGLGK